MLVCLTYTTHYITELALMRTMSAGRNRHQQYLFFNFFVMGKAYLFTVEEEVKEIAPKTGDSFTLEEMQAIVGGYIQIVTLPRSGMQMVMNEEGQITGLPKNTLATSRFQAEFPKDEYPENNGQTIYGNVIVCNKEFVK